MCVIGNSVSQKRTHTIDSRRQFCKRALVGMTGVIGVGASSTSASATGRAAKAKLASQSTDGKSVAVHYAYLPDGGYVSIHDVGRFGATRLGNDAPEDVILGSIVGITDYLEPGQYTNLTVDLFTKYATFEQDDALNDGSRLVRSQPLLVIPHTNTDETGTGFREDPEDPGTQLSGDAGGDGAYRDGPKTVSSLPVVNDIATVSLWEPTEAQVAIVSSDGGRTEWRISPGDIGQGLKLWQGREHRWIQQRSEHEPSQQRPEHDRGWQGSEGEQGRGGGAPEEIADLREALKLEIAIRRGVVTPP